MQPFPQERWVEVERLLDAALERAPDQRAGFIEQTSSGDALLCSEVESLLQATAASVGFLEAPALTQASSFISWVTGRQTIAPGRRFGAYEITSMLGRGGMATVYLARDHKHHRSVALKVLHPGLAAAIGPERFLQEIEIAATLQHPHIIPLFDSGAADGLLYYVMPHIKGESLRQRLAQHAPLPVSDALRIAQEVAGALDYAHRQGVVHRDIKPENILLQDGQAIVADFGIARAIDVAGADRLTESGFATGTPAYMSPEQASASAPIDGRADIYALGCVLYELLAGQPPFVGPTVEAVLTSHAEEPVPALERVRPTVPEAIAQAVTRALAKDRADRFPTAIAFAQSLVTSGQAGGPPVPSASNATGASLLRRRNRAVVAGGTALLLTLLGAVVWQQHHAVQSPASATAAHPRLAVLPFESLGDSVDSYVADGITEAVRDKLAGLSGLEVIASTSSDQYRHTTKLPSQVGRELGVGYLLSGKVHWVGASDSGTKRLQVHPELIEAASGAERWGQAFEIPLAYVIHLPVDLASQVAQTLSIPLGADERERLFGRSTRDLAAYDFYIQGRTLWHHRTPRALQTAARYFERAIERDSSYAQAYAALAEAYELFPDYGADSPGQAYPRAKAAAMRALALDSTVAQAHLVLADIRAFYDWDWPGADSEYRRAIALSPSYATAHHWYANYLVALGRLDAALAETRLAHMLDPLSENLSVNEGFVLYRGRRYDEAIAQLLQSLDLDPNLAVAHDWLGSAYLEKGKQRKAISELETAVRLSGSRIYQGDLAYAYSVSGQRDRALGILRELTERSRHEYVSPGVFAVAYTGLGDRDRAFAWLERAADSREIIVTSLATEPFFDPLRSDPRFTRLLHRVRLK
jgi:serine/threonine-protein kinase